MRLAYCILLLGVGGVMLSCKEDPRKEIAKIVTEWQNKEIVFPHDLVFTRYGRDTLDYEIPPSSRKILMYVDSIGCTSCKLQLHKWKEFIEEVDSLTYGMVPVVFVFHPKDSREISYLLKRDGIDIPVCIDGEDKLNALNHFPAHSEFQTFLLDEEDRVLFIGNPVHNARVKEMYLSEISPNGYQGEVTPPLPNTLVEAGSEEFDLGTIPIGEAITVQASIKNSGDSPFMILDTRASCGCTGIEYEKKPIPPDSTTRVSITYHADETGRFNKKVFVYGNMDNSPLIIRLKGNVK